LRVPLLLLSFFALILHFISYSKSWQEIMHALGAPISLSQSAWMIATTQIGKYIPGKIWYMLGRVYIGTKEKIDGKSLAVSMVLETCLLLISSSIIFLLSTIINGNYSTIYLSICIVLTLLAITVLHPRILSWATNFILRLFNKREIQINVSYLQIIKLSVYFFGLWIAQIIGFYLLIRAIYPVSITNIFTVSAAYTLSWMVGFAVIIVPGGLGVREGMMSLLLSPILPAPLDIAISFIARVWITVFELVVFFIGLAIQRKTSTRPRP
jgi:uncharacterized membrane protein YbhN (UPF0104 family)